MDSTIRQRSTFLRVQTARAKSRLWRLSKRTQARDGGTRSSGLEQRVPGLWASRSVRASAGSVKGSNFAGRYRTPKNQARPFPARCSCGEIVIFAARCRASCAKIVTSRLELDGTQECLPTGPTLLLLSRSLEFCGLLDRLRGRSGGTCEGMNESSPGPQVHFSRFSAPVVCPQASQTFEISAGRRGFSGPPQPFSQPHDRAGFSNERPFVPFAVVVGHGLSAPE